MTNATLDPLPPEARRALTSEGAQQAGEWLLGHAERLARSRPGEARRWATRLADAHLEDGVLTGYARWAAGVALYLGGDVAAAEPSLREAAQRLTAVGQRAVADRVRLALVDVHGERFEIDRARRLALRLNRRFSERGDSERAAAALVNLACAEDAADRVARARDLWRRARRNLAEGSLRRLLTDANLANVAALEGSFAEAASELERVAELAREQGLDSVALQAELNLAEVEFLWGKVDAAFARWQRVSDEARAAGNDAVLITAEFDYAEAEAALGDLAGARDRIARGLPAARQLGLERELVRGRCLRATLDAADGVLDSWRRVVRQLGGRQYAAQRDLLLVEVSQLDPTCDPGRVSRAARRLLRSGHTQRGRLGLAWAARRCLDRGRRSRARSLAREALAGRRVSLWTRMVAHHVLGRVGGPDSLRHLSSAARAADRVAERLAAAADRQAFLSLRSDVYLDLLEELLKRNRPEHRRRALAIAGRLRAGWLLDELARRSDRLDDPLVQRWQQLRARLAALLREVEGQDEPRVRRSGLRLHRTIQAVERDLRRAEMELARRWPGASPQHGRGLVDELLRRLPAGDAFVEYVLHRGDLVVFCGHAGRLGVHRLSGRGAEIADIMDSVQFHIEAHTWLDERLVPAQSAALNDRLSRLGELLLDVVPVEGVERLWIAPGAGLVQVPWAALPGARGDRQSLLDRVQLTLVPGAEAAVMLLRTRGQRPRSVAIGGSPSPTLPMVERELNELADLSPGASVSSTATREEFLGLLATHDAVHLAGHAVFLDGLPFASGLRMSDGYVTVRDLAATRLAARFVSFGVCSGLRLGRERGDRYAGFVLALLGGGVRTVVGAMAPVRDDVAYAFDIALHTALNETGDPGKAYRSAVQAVRRLDPRSATWGSFQLYGDPRSWDN
jgi:hypothetical protein